jgi:hypothetical protein
MPLLNVENSYKFVFYLFNLIVVFSNFNLTFPGFNIIGSKNVVVDAREEKEAARRNEDV